MKKKFPVIFIFILLVPCLWAVQSHFTELKGLYLGQKAPGDLPQIFAPGIISNPDTIEYAGVFTPDGKSFYFTRRQKIRSDQRIWYSKIKNGFWTRPEKYKPSKEYMSYEPIFSTDGNTMFFGSQAPFPKKPQSDNLTFFWYLTRDQKGWTRPKLLPESIRNELPSYISISGRDSLYFGSYQHSGILIAEKKAGNWIKPHPVHPIINDFPGVGHPFIASDESFLIFDSNRAKDSFGAFDLFISFKDSDGSWTNPINFGSSINSSASELCASVTPDGKYLFFNRWGLEGSDIYWVKSGIINVLKSGILK